MAKTVNKNKAIVVAPDIKGMYEKISAAKAENHKQASDPEVSPDGIIKMGLMLGGDIEICKPNGSHVMRAAREMAVADEKGNRAEMRVIYTMVACAKIDSLPMEMYHVDEKLSARDLMVLSDVFQDINLL